jgi:PAS domain S-box-containing protein
MPSTESADFYRALLENATDLIAVLDADGTIRHVSDSAVRILGYRPAELVGTNAFALIHPDDLGDVLEAVRAGIERRDTGLPMTFQVRRRDGSWRFLEATDRNLLDEPAVAGLVINGRDVTDRVVAEKALRENDRRKDEFLAMLAHELRNPLAPIQSAARLLRVRGREDPALIEWASGVVDRQVQSLVRLVDDLLDVSRITRGMITIQKQPVDVAQMITRAVETVRPLIEAREQELTVDAIPESVQVDGDPVRLPQVIANILNNAAKYTPVGGHIRIHVARRSSEVEIHVEDDGLGIRADVLPRIFDLFTQGDRALDRAHGGLGVGLTLVRRLVEMHDGSVEATSAGPGRGSAFVVRLPMRKRVAEPPPPARARNAVAGFCRVLVVDDNVDAAETLAMMLRVLGQRVETAHDGIAAIDLAVRSAPDLVLLDIGLPGLDGYEVARRLRGRMGTKPMLVAVTGYGQEEDRIRSREAGFDRHVVKPVDERVLAEIVHQCLARSR